jgi:hypothetical protein
LNVSIGCYLFKFLARLKSIWQQLSLIVKMSFKIKSLIQNSESRAQTLVSKQSPSLFNLYSQPPLNNAILIEWINSKFSQSINNTINLFWKHLFKFCFLPPPYDFTLLAVRRVTGADCILRMISFFWVDQGPQCSACLVSELLETQPLQLQ